MTNPSIKAEHTLKLERDGPTVGRSVKRKGGRNYSL